jgi:uncharacterized protein YkwD
VLQNIVLKNVILYSANGVSKVSCLMFLAIGISCGSMLMPVVARAEPDCPYANQESSDEQNDQSSAQTLSASAIESRLLELTNRERRRAGLAPLSLSRALSAAAQNHAQDMDGKNYFDHTGMDGSEPSDRTQRMGYSGQMIGENIAAGNSTPEDTIRQWMNSPGHRENILNPDYQEIGFGYSRDGGGTYNHYWVQVFGSR